VKKAILIFISLYISLVVFMPKEQILYTLLNQAQKQRVNFIIEDVSDYGIYADIKNTTVIYDKMQILNIEDMKLYPFLLYNKLSITTAEPKSTFRNMLNLVVLSASINYTPFLPTKLSIKAQTTIGEVNGEFDISDAKLKLVLTPNDRFKTFKYKRYFKKKEGGYVYESYIR